MEDKKCRFEEYFPKRYPSENLNLTEQLLEEQLAPIMWQSIGDYFNQDVYAVPSGPLSNFMSMLKANNSGDKNLLRLLQYLITFQKAEDEKDDYVFPIPPMTRDDSSATPPAKPVSHKKFSGEYMEGEAHTDEVTRYERDRNARLKCIEIYGCECYICGFNFAKRYGQDGEGFIEVHHLVRVADRGGAYKPDPEKDLRPLCSNCHSMVHHCHWDKEQVESMHDKYHTEQ